MAVDELSRYLSNKDPEKRRISVETLANFALTDSPLLRDSGVIEKLIERLKNEGYYPVRTAIANTLKYLAFFGSLSVKTNSIGGITRRGFEER